MPRGLVVSIQPEALTFLRARYLGWEWEATDDPDEAIRLLTKQSFDRLFLAHWLRKEPKNGRDVSIFLGVHPECNPKIEVFSITETADKGRETVQECKRVAYHVPMSILMALGV